MPELHVGAALWALRSTASAPRSTPGLYRSALDDARYLEALGFDSFWLAEHRFWYDGWCPQPLVLAGAIAAGTSTIRIGTAMHLLGQHTPERSRAMARTLGHHFPGRIELGVSLGYRDEEFDGLGLRLANRPRLLEAGLDAIGEEPTCPPIWIGGMADAAMARAGRRGLSLLLPPTLNAAQLDRCIHTARNAAAEAGTTVPHIGMLKDVWIGSPDEGAERIAAHYEEYVAAWWGLDEDGNPDAARIEKQLERSVRAAAIGPPTKVTEELASLVEQGVDTIVLQIHLESTLDAHRAQFALAAAEIVPTLRSLKPA